MLSCDICPGVGLIKCRHLFFICVWAYIDLFWSSYSQIGSWSADSVFPPQRWLYERVVEVHIFPHVGRYLNEQKALANWTVGGTLEQKAWISGVGKLSCPWPGEKEDPGGRVW